ncbi:hypothetical protein BJ138DRAFT_1131340 [Hygrophoropsis aurantiaca]|uniref:Uncharacterized protein n=1 Tax=Hygrophoropsis aurantiaca TaxID=72124 RepID=A0ACB7ZQR2_9AGAM|nr:hypothetical protein BJ138DRAFT_1131340 [Hygrophoropsis aurantiaca]
MLCSFNMAMITPEELFPPIDLSSTIGFGYWGVLVDSLLTGITVLQLFLYFQNHHKDHFHVKITVISLCILDVLSWALFCYAYYYYLVRNYGNDLALLTIPWPFGTEVIVEAFVCFGAQMFFASQVYGINRKSWPVAAFIAMLALIALATGITVGVISIHNRSMQFVGSKTLEVLTDINKGLATVTDIVATIAMCYFLSSARSGVKRTNSIIKSLMFWAIHRGILLTAWQSADLFLYVAAPSKDYWVPFHMNLSKIYVNTMLAMLNARSTLRKQNGSGFSSIHLTSHGQTLANSDTYTLEPPPSDQRFSAEFQSKHQPLTSSVQSVFKKAATCEDEV